MSTETQEPRPNRQAERTARSTAALLDAASELIVEGGFDSLTFAAIGERAGYSRGLVTARFGSKDGLVEALIERIVATWNHRNVLPRTKGKTGLEAIATILDAIATQAERDPKGLRVLYALLFEAVGPDEGLRLRIAKFQDAMRDDFRSFLRRGQQDGSIVSGLDVEREAVFLVGGLRGVGFQWLLEPDTFDPAIEFRYLHDVSVERLQHDATPSPDSEEELT